MFFVITTEFPEEHNKKLAMQSLIFNHQAYFIKVSIFTDKIKKIESGFSSLYQKGLSKIYSVEKKRLLGVGEGIPLKKDRNR